MSQESELEGAGTSIQANREKPQIVSFEQKIVYVQSARKKNGNVLVSELMVNHSTHAVIYAACGLCYAEEQNLTCVLLCI